MESTKPGQPRHCGLTAPVAGRQGLLEVSALTAASKTEPSATPNVTDCTAQLGRAACWSRATLPA